MCVKWWNTQNRNWSLSTLICISISIQSTCLSSIYTKIEDMCGYKTFICLLNNRSNEFESICQRKLPECDTRHVTTIHGTRTPSVLLLLWRYLSSRIQMSYFDDVLTAYLACKCLGVSKWRSSYTMRSACHALYNNKKNGRRLTIDSSTHCTWQP